MTNKNIKVGIIGASGYTGSELIRLILKHPNINLEFAAANNNAGQKLNEIFPYLYGTNDITLKKWEDLNWNSVDVIFSCLPHGIFHEIFLELPKNKLIIDLSADFRLIDSEHYSQWYNFEHKSKKYINKFVYGLTELNREQIKKTNNISCPGCYPTATLLGLYPLIKEGIADTESIVINAKSGISGAGRNPKRDMLFPEISESIRPYNIVGHRHIPEIEQQIEEYANNPQDAIHHKAVINFIPHLVPMNRGELVVMHINLKKYINIKDMHCLFNSYYMKEEFIQVLQDGVLPNTINVRGTNNCQISISPSRIKDSIVVISSIDNLIKGSSGQAVQNMNLNLGLGEEIGLSHISLFP
jgi:N-acetyl-gamma-glutamyl-phosphate reductase